MPSAGSSRLHLTDVDAPKRLGPVKVRFTIGTIDARRTRSWTTTYRHVRGKPRYRVLEAQPVRAVRRRTDVRVTVRAERAPDSEAYFIVGGFARRGNVEPLVSGSAFLLPGRRESSVSLPGAGVRWVAVLRGGGRKFLRVH
jgi:hypothetical protein